jgi:hypothetical protein
MMMDGIVTNRDPMLARLLFGQTIKRESRGETDDAVLRSLDGLKQIIPTEILTVLPFISIT